jgi:hypothetical protein
MSQIAMTGEERLAALARFGYTEPEAAFLSLAALHGGYFLRRQVNEFLGRQDSGTVSQLIHKAMAFGHLRTSALQQKTQLYHVCARPFYGALGQPDNRNRRIRQLPAIANKIMALDFVLAHREYQYLATEKEKLEYFTVDLKLDPSILPAKEYPAAQGDLSTRRFFVEKYPIFLPAPPQDGTPFVSFCFVDEGLVGLSRFENFLKAYAGLFTAVPRFQVIYVAAKEMHFAGARRAFERMVNGSSGALTESEMNRLLEYFEARQLYESRQFAGFDRAKLLRLRDARAEFSDPQSETLYERWKTGGDQALRQRLALKTESSRTVHGTFSTYLLRHDYACFGYLAAW